MDISAVKKNIKDKKVNSLYIFTGPEVAVMDIYIKKLAGVRNASVSHADSIEDIFKSCKKKSFIKSNFCYVLRDDKEFMSNETIWQNVKTILDDNILIFIVTKVDKRGKFYKRFKDDIVEFDYLKEDILRKYIQKDVDLDTKNCNILIDVCEKNYSRILLEIDKIKNYSEVKKITADQAFNELLSTGGIYKPAKDAIFDFADSVLRRDYKSFELCDECYRSGEATLVMVSVLYMNFKQVLQVQSCRSSNVVSSTGLTSWQIKCAKEKCGRYTIPQLVDALKLLREIEKGIKTGLIEESVAMNYFLVNVL